ncbi:MAG: hypothetical protein ABIV63_06940 [Caldimonas sp.]
MTRTRLPAPIADVLALACAVAVFLAASIDAPRAPRNGPAAAASTATSP